jgi:hypothetical protein
MKGPQPAGDESIISETLNFYLRVLYWGATLTP